MREKASFTCFHTGCDHPVPGATGPMAGCGCCTWFAWWGTKDKTWKRYYRSFPAECRAELEAVVA